MRLAGRPGPLLVVCALARELKEFAMPAGTEMLECGVGPVDAACAVARRLGGSPVRAVLNAGIGGVFEGCGSIGDAFAVAEERLADLGLEGGAPLVLPAGAGLIDGVSADAEMVAFARDCGLRVGRGVTVSLVTTTERTALARRGRYLADVESMEGFAVLRAARLAAVPALEVRGISNLVTARERSGWDFEAGARALAAALRSVVPALLSP